MVVQVPWYLSRIREGHFENGPPCAFPLIRHHSRQSVARHGARACRDALFRLVPAFLVLLPVLSILRHANRARMLPSYGDAVAQAQESTLWLALVLVGLSLFCVLSYLSCRAVMLCVELYPLL